MNRLPKRLIFITAFSLAFISPLHSHAASPTPSPKPDSPTYFRTSGLGDLSDIKKDISDAKLALEKGGSWRLLGNAAELSFNIGQLEALNPPTQYAKTWNKQVSQLSGLSDQFLDSISNGSVSNTRSILSKMSKIVKSMETFLKKVK